jgi:hypothetical protein
MATNTQSMLHKLEQLVHYSLRPLPPRYGDGRYNADVDPKVIKTGILKDLESQLTRIPQDIDLLLDAIVVLYRNGIQDDSKYFVSPILWQQAECRWRRLSNSWHRFLVLRKTKSILRTDSSPICGMFCFIRLFRMLEIFMLTELLMALTMYTLIGMC